VTAADPDPPSGAFPLDPAPEATAEPDLGHRPAGSAARRRSRRAEPGILGAIAFGGALGAPARYGISQLVDVTPGTFPWGTFWTNITGSFALGFLFVVLLERFPPSRYLRPFVASGFLGAFTTYSTFAMETDLLVKNGHVAVALAYAVGSLVGGFAAVWAGVVLARVAPITRGGRP
jgi:CrcB protein